MEIAKMLNVFVVNNLQYIIVVLTIMMLLALIVFISINIKLNRLTRRYRKMMQGTDGLNLERMLLAHVDEIRQATKKVEQLDEKYNIINQNLQQTVQKVGIIRFNAFEDTGSDLSFAVALLDANNNGVVLSSIYGRNEFRIYAKPINKGQSTYFLTEEEKEALRQAISG